METDEVKRLLEKYYEGVTTGEEEHLLREYFRTHEVPPEMKADEALFLTWEEERTLRASPGLSRRLETLIDDHRGGVRTLRHSRIRRLVRYSVPAAATVLLLVAAWYLTAPLRQPRDTYRDPVLAYQETKVVLLYVSAQLNKGTQNLACLKEAERPVHALEKVGETAATARRAARLRFPGQGPER